MALQFVVRLNGGEEWSPFSAPSNCSLLIGVLKGTAEPNPCIIFLCVFTYYIYFNTPSPRRKGKANMAVRRVCTPPGQIHTLTHTCDNENMDHSRLKVPSHSLGLTVEAHLQPHLWVWGPDPMDGGSGTAICLCWVWFPPHTHPSCGLSLLQAQAHHGSHLPPAECWSSEAYLQDLVQRWPIAYPIHVSSSFQMFCLLVTKYQ